MRILVGAAAFALGAMGGVASATVTINTVPVGNTGNLADASGYGAVGYTYGISRYEVTAGQYAEFLNAVAATDTYNLYNTLMASNTAGCRIVRTGVAGSFSYSVAADYANRPVNYVSWGDAARFANWMHNGQPAGPQGLGTTESGAYALNGVADTSLSTINRESGALWAIPSEDEWYKAAYHANDGNSGTYWTYATASNVLPGKLLNDVSGNNANFGPNPAVPIDGGLYWTTVAGEFENSLSGYGTFDQAGNVTEWTEARGTGTQRIARGGGWIQNGASLSSATRSALASGGNSQNYVGFRLVMLPSPGSIGAMVVAGAMFSRRRRMV